MRLDIIPERPCLPVGGDRAYRAPAAALLESLAKGATIHKPSRAPRELGAREGSRAVPG